MTAAQRSAATRSAAAAKRTAEKLAASEPAIKELLASEPEMTPAQVAMRIGWQGALEPLKEQVTSLRPDLSAIARPKIEALLDEDPDMPLLTIGARIDWRGRLRVLTDLVRELRPDVEDLVPRIRNILDGEPRLPAYEIAERLGWRRPRADLYAKIAELRPAVGDGSVEDRIRAVLASSALLTSDEVARQVGWNSDLADLRVLLRDLRPTFEQYLPQIRKLLREDPKMPANEIAAKIGWTGSEQGFAIKVGQIRTVRARRSIRWRDVEKRIAAVTPKVKDLLAKDPEMSAAQIAKAVGWTGTFARLLALVTELRAVPASWVRTPRGSVGDAYRDQILALLAQDPTMPASKIGKEIGWTRSQSRLEQTVKALRTVPSTWTRIAPHEQVQALEPQIREALAENPKMTVAKIAERVGWTGPSAAFAHAVAALRNPALGVTAAEKGTLDKIRALLITNPALPSTKIAEQIDWQGSISSLRFHVRSIREEVKTAKV